MIKAESWPGLCVSSVPQPQSSRFVYTDTDVLLSKLLKDELRNPSENSRSISVTSGYLYDAFCNCYDCYNPEWVFQYSGIAKVTQPFKITVEVNNLSLNRKAVWGNYDKALVVVSIKSQGFIQHGSLILQITGQRHCKWWTWPSDTWLGEHVFTIYSFVTIL